MDALDPSLERMFPEDVTSSTHEKTPCSVRVRELIVALPRIVDVIFRLKDEGYTLTETTVSLYNQGYFVRADEVNNLLWHEGYGFSWSEGTTHHTVLLDNNLE